MNYREKQYEEIFEAMLQDSLEKGLISHADEFESYIKNHQDISNYYVMDKSVIAEMFAKIYKSLTSIYESQKIEYAEGIDLDNFGKILGLPRPGATSAEVEVTFTLRGRVEEDVTIPAGVIVSTNSGIEYATLEQIFIPVGSNETKILARAVEPGVKSKIVENSIKKILSDIEYNFNVNNPSPSTGGGEAYTDDEYRYFLMNWTKILIKGSEEAFEYYFANFDGIDSYKLVPNWDGTGTIKCVLNPGTSDQLNRAYNDLQNKVTQATEDIVMVSPANKYIDIYAIVNVDIDQINPYSSVEKDNIKSKIISAIKTFIDGGYRRNGEWYPGLYLGEDFIPHKLAVFLDYEIPELKNIEFNYPEDYVRILDEECGVSNEITIEMI